MDACDSRINALMMSVRADVALARMGKVIVACHFSRVSLHAAIARIAFTLMTQPRYPPYLDSFGLRCGVTPLRVRNNIAR